MRSVDSTLLGISLKWAVSERSGFQMGAPKGVIVLLVVLKMSWGDLLMYILNFNIDVFFLNMYLEIPCFPLVAIQFPFN